MFDKWDELGESSVIVFGCAPEAIEGMSLADVLSIAEHNRAARFRFDTDRRLYVAAHTLLRYLLAGRSGTAPNAIRIGNRSRGKPFLPDLPQIEFSLSHTNGYVLVAISKTPVGVDVEQLRSVPAEYRDLISDLDAEYISSLHGVEREAAFFRCWTRTEALLKGMGTGLLDDPNRVSGGAGPQPHVRLVQGVESEGHWRAFDLRLPGGLVGALAIDSEEPLDLVSGDAEATSHPPSILSFRWRPAPSAIFSNAFSRYADPRKTPDASRQPESVLVRQ